MTYSQIINEELTQLGIDIISASELQGQKASGDTYKSLRVENITDFAGQLSGDRHIGVLATGRKGGGVPNDFAEIIMEWASYKGLSSKFDTQEDFERFANAVKWKTIREGSKLFREQGGVALPSIFEIPIKNFMDRLTKRIAVAAQKSVINEIDKILRR